MSSKEYKELRKKLLFEVLEKYRDTPSNTLARMLYNANPGLWMSIEGARGRIRVYRGQKGIEARRKMKTTKYYTYV